jgi:hypothetical protein
MWVFFIKSLKEHILECIQIDLALYMTQENNTGKLNARDTCKS